MSSDQAGWRARFGNVERGGVFIRQVFRKIACAGVRAGKGNTRRIGNDRAVRSSGEGTNFVGGFRRRLARRHGAGNRTDREQAGAIRVRIRHPSGGQQRAQCHCRKGKMHRDHAQKLPAIHHKHAQNPNRAMGIVMALRRRNIGLANCRTPAAGRHASGIRGHPLQQHDRLRVADGAVADHGEGFVQRKLKHFDILPLAFVAAAFGDAVGGGIFGGEQV